jgi:vacuolar protein sorting-associated protein VTA1
VEKQTPDDELQALDPNDPEVRALQGDRPDEADRVQRSLAQQSILNESLHPSRSSSLPRPASTSGTSKPDHLPTVPAEISLPSAPSDLTLPQTPSALPDKPITFTDPSTALESFPPPAVVQMSHAADPAEQPPLPKSFTQHATSIPPAATATAPTAGAVAAAAPAAASMAPAPSASQATSYGITANDQAIAQAQKHAKWAVSALSFDDVPTAIKELKLALRQLGAE